jgi:hypothetical protein
VLGIDGMRGVRGGARGATGLAWRARRTATGRDKEAVSQGATHGICRGQEVALIGSQRWRAVANSGSGRRQAAWHGGERPMQLGETVALG